MGTTVGSRNRNKDWNRFGEMAAVVIAAVTIAAAMPATAQIEPKAYPSVRTTDAANVDLMTGLPFWSVEDIRIGNDSVGLKHAFFSYMASFSTPRDSFHGGRVWSDATKCPGHSNLGTSFYMVYQQAGECFYLKNGVYSSNEGLGGHLQNDANGNLTYTIRDGTKITASPLYFVNEFMALITRIERPDGLVTSIHYTVGGHSGTSRINSVSNSAGFRFQYVYQSDNPTQIEAWYTVVGVIGYNAAYVACDPAVPCSIPNGWPRSQVAHTRGQAYSTSITAASGERTIFSGNTNPFPNYGRFTSVQLPAQTSPSIFYKYCPNDPGCTIYIAGYPGPVTKTIQQFTLSATIDGATWTYGMTSAGPYQIQRRSTSPTGLTTTLMQREEGWNVSLVTPGPDYYFTNGIPDRLTSVTSGEGDLIRYTYDARGNIAATAHVPEPGFSGPHFTSSAVYPSVCVNRITCNRPTTVSDANGNTTTYTYDPVHGGVLTAVGPSDANGVPRSVRYTYVQKYARYLGPSGVVVQSPTPIWLLESERTCRTSALSGNSCSAPNDEVVTLYEYGPDTGVNNLLLRGVVHDATGLAARTCYGYDRLGNRISETTPNAGLGVCP